MRPTIATLLASILAVAGCGTVTPSSAPTVAPTAPGPSEPARPAAEVYAEIRAQVIALRGLEPTKAVEPVALDEADLRAALAAEFDRENTPDELRLTEDLLITVGLLPAGSSLRTIMLDFQTGQVAGYYSPEKDEMFVVSRSGGLGAAERVTYAHEFTHQLQDQRIDLETLGLDVVDQSDRQLARLSLVEGDAVSIQSSWMTSNLTPQQLGELLQSSLDPKALAALQNAPPYVRETQLFPYENGLAFVTTLMGGGGYATVDAAFKDPPDSTEQILHPDKYLDREAPVAVTIPDGVAAKLGPEWREAGRDTLGELILGSWLRTGKVPSGDALVAAEGWAGDRAVILRGPDGAVGVGLITEWDSATDAAEFAAASSTAIAGHGLVAHAWLEPNSSRVVLAFGEWYAQIGAALGA